MNLYWINLPLFVFLILAVVLKGLKLLMKNIWVIKKFNLIIKQFSKCRKNDESKNPKVLEKQEKKWFHQTVLFAALKKVRFIKEWEASWLLISLGITTLKLI